MAYAFGDRDHRSLFMQLKTVAERASRRRVSRDDLLRFGTSQFEGRRRLPPHRAMLQAGLVLFFRIEGTSLSFPPPSGIRVENQ
jgi:hypothetical protein